MNDIIDGRNQVLEALKSGRPITRVLLARNMPHHTTLAEIIHACKSNGIPFEYVDRSVLDQKVPRNQGVVAFAAAKDYVELEDVLAVSRRKNEPPFLVILDGIEDPHNFGAILRTAECAGVHGVVTRERRAVGLTGAVAAASAGAIEYVPVARVVNIAQTIEVLKKENIWVTGIDMAGEVEYTRANFKPGMALVVGGEGKGLSDLVKKRCDTVVRIPMKGKINSLNASIAAALVMYEVVRQRGEGGGRGSRSGLSSDGPV